MWINENKETGEPYDIVVNSENDTFHYFEVKSTSVLFINLRL